MLWFVFDYLCGIEVLFGGVVEGVFVLFVIDGGCV